LKKAKKKVTVLPKIRFLVDEQEEVKEEKLHDEPVTHEKVQRDLAKANMNKYILQFQYVKDAYSEIDKAFGANIETKNPTQKLKDKMKRTIPVTKIRILFNYLGYPDFSNQELKEIFCKNITSEHDLITFKRLLVGSVECYYEKQDDEYKNENEITKQRYDIISKGFNIVKNMFDAIDINGNGEITKSQFRRAFISLCKDEELVDIRMQELDYTHSQEITFREFVYGISGWVGFVD